MRNLRVLAMLAIAVAPSVVLGDFRFVHTSDQHVSGKQGNAETDERLFKEIAGLSPRPAFVAGTGDLCETGTPAEYVNYLAVVPALGDVPAHMAPGNHDVRWNPLGKEGFTLGSKQPMYQSWSYDNVHFVLLDSTCLLQHWGHFDADMLEWLKKDLSQWGTERPVVIGFHHPIGRETVQVDNEQELLDLVAPYNVRLWLQGHGHANIQWNVNGVPAIMVQGLYQGAYNVVDIKGDNLIVTRRHLAGGRKKQQAGELLGGASPEAVTTPVLTSTLRKVPAPSWEATLEGGRIQVSRGALPAEAAVAYRVDSGDYVPMDKLAGGWSATPTIAMAGVHTVTVQATLADGRAYQKPLSTTVTKPGTPTPAWETNVGGSVLSRLVRDGDSLYVSSMGNSLLSLDPQSGKERWRFKTEAFNFSTPDVTGGVVYFGSADHCVYAVDAATGEMKWKARTEGAVLAGPAVAKGTVCAASCDRTIYGLDAATGKVKWTVRTGGMTQSKAATDGTLFFVGTWDNQFRAIDAESGRVVWSHKFGKSSKGAFSFYFAPAIGSPTVAEGKVFISSNDGLLHAVEIATGKLAWESEKSYSLGYSSPLYHDGRIYSGSLPGKVHCFSAADGKHVWTVDTGAEIYDSSPAISPDGSTLFLSCVNGTFSAISAVEGKIVWQSHLPPGHVLASPTTDEARAYIASMSGRVTAFPVK